MSSGPTKRAIVLLLALAGALGQGCYGVTRAPLDDGGSDGGLSPDGSGWTAPDAAADARPDVYVPPNEDADVLPIEDADWDGGGFVPGECGSDMVRVPGLRACIDRFEASRSEDDTPVSARGARPWTYVSQDEAARACELAGKRLCTAEEWLAACSGGDGRPYPYGSFFDAGRCNDQSRVEGAPIGTGEAARCEGGVEGLFDMSGNVAEWLVTPSLADGDGGMWYEPVGGSFDEAEGCSFRTNGGFNPETVRFANIGFRCCRAL